MSSISSSTMTSLPSLAYSLRETEDLYCDDELHPSLENDPNMRLYTEDSNIDNHTIDFGDGHAHRIFDIEDDGKVDNTCDIMRNVQCFRFYLLPLYPQPQARVSTELQQDRYREHHLQWGQSACGGGRCDQLNSSCMGCGTAY